MGLTRAFPGAQFASFVDDKGNPLPGAPAVVPWLNQGTENFTGFVSATAQGTSSPSVTVTVMTPYDITAASYNAASGLTPAEVQFTVSANPGFIPGSEFIVSGVTPSGYNQTYVAVAGTSGTTIKGNPLSGALGTPQPLANPGTFVLSGSPQMVSVIMPGEQINGVNAGVVLAPYGSFTGSGIGGVGTYATTNNLTPFTFTGHIDNGSGRAGNILTAPANFAVIGSGITGAGITAGTVVDGLLTATTYHVNNAQLVPSETLTNTENIGTSGAPVQMFATPIFYQTGASSLTSPGYVTSPRPQSTATLTDFINLIGAETTTVGKVGTGWGGALANVSMLYGAFPMTASGAPDTTQLASICQKQQDIQTFAQAQTAGGNVMTVHSLYRLNDPGIWGDSSNATIKGYVDSASGTVAGTATLHVLSTTFGSLALPSGAQTATLTAPGLAGVPLTSPTIPLTTSSSATYTVQFGAGITSANLGSAGSPLTLNVGRFKPATPLQSNLVNGFLSGNTLTVTSVQSGATSTFTGQLNTGFTAKIDNGLGSGAGNTLTVTAPISEPAGFGSVIGVGTVVSDVLAGVAPGTTVLKQIDATGATGGVWGMAGHYTVGGSAQNVSSRAMLGSGPNSQLRDADDRDGICLWDPARHRRRYHGWRDQHKCPQSAPDNLWIGNELGYERELLSSDFGRDDVRDAHKRRARHVRAGARDQFPYQHHRNSVVDAWRMRCGRGSSCDRLPGLWRLHAIQQRERDGWLIQLPHSDHFHRHWRWRRALLLGPR